MGPRYRGSEESRICALPPRLVACHAVHLPRAVQLQASLREALAAKHSQAPAMPYFAFHDADP